MLDNETLMKRYLVIFSYKCAFSYELMCDRLCSSPLYCLYVRLFFKIWKHVGLLSTSDPTLVDMVKNSLRRCSFSIFGRSYQFQWFVTNRSKAVILTFLTWEHIQAVRSCILSL